MSLNKFTKIDEVHNWMEINTNKFKCEGEEIHDGDVKIKTQDGLGYNNFSTVTMGTPNQILETNGDGLLGWVDNSGGMSDPDTIARVQNIKLPETTINLTKIVGTSELDIVTANTLTLNGNNVETDISSLQNITTDISYTPSLTTIQNSALITTDLQVNGQLQVITDDLNTLSIKPSTLGLSGQALISDGSGDVDFQTILSINDAVTNSSTTWSSNKIAIELEDAGNPNYYALQGSVVKVNLNTTNSQPTYGKVEVYISLSNLSAGQPVVFDYGSNGEISVKALSSIDILNQQLAGISLNTTSIGSSCRILVEGYCTVRRTTTNDIPPVGTPLYINPNDITRVSEFDTSNLSAGCIVAYNDYSNNSVFVRVKRPQINKKIHNDIALIHEPNLYYQFLAYEKDGTDTYQIDYEGGATIAADINGNKFFSFPTSNSLIVDNSFRTKSSDVTFVFYIKQWGSEGVDNATTLLTGLEKFYDESDVTPRMPSIVYRLEGGVYSMIVTSSPRVGIASYHPMPNARQDDVLVGISIEYISSNSSQLKIYNSVDNDIVINVPWGDDRFIGDASDIKAGLYGKQLNSASSGLQLYGLKCYNKAFNTLLEFQNVTKESFLLTDTPIYEQYNNAFINDNISTTNTTYSSIYIDNRLQNSPQTFYYNFTRNTNSVTDAFYIDDYIELSWDGFDEIFIRQPFTAISNVYCQLITNVGGSFPSGQSMLLATVNNDYYQNSSIGNCHFLIQAQDDNTHPLYKILVSLPATSGLSYMTVLVEKYIL